MYIQSVAHDQFAQNTAESFSPPRKYTARVFLHCAPQLPSLRPRSTEKEPLGVATVRHTHFHTKEEGKRQGASVRRIQTVSLLSRFALPCTVCEQQTTTTSSKSGQHDIDHDRYFDTTGAAAVRGALLPPSFCCSLASIPHIPRTEQKTKSIASIKRATPSEAFHHPYSYLCQ